MKFSYETDGEPGFRNITDVFTEVEVRKTNDGGVDVSINQTRHYESGKVKTFFTGIHVPRESVQDVIDEMARKDRGPVYRINPAQAKYLADIGIKGAAHFIYPIDPSTYQTVHISDHDGRTIGSIGLDVAIKLKSINAYFDGERVVKECPGDVPGAGVAG